MKLRVRARVSHKGPSETSRLCEIARVAGAEAVQPKRRLAAQVPDCVLSCEQRSFHVCHAVAGYLVHWKLRCRALLTGRASSSEIYSEWRGAAGWIKGVNNHCPLLPI